jgi:predicted DCC family thiol-disulfide oxidoreductase YuxK
MEISKEFIIFDGNCGFCNKSVMFIARNDIADKYLFVSNNSNLGKELIFKNNIKTSVKESIILVKNNTHLIRTSAFIEILLNLPKYKFLGNIINIFPLYFSDTFYKIISKYRLHILKSNTCPIPNNSIKNKFIL